MGSISPGPGGGWLPFSSCSRSSRLDFSPKPRNRFYIGRTLTESSRATVRAPGLDWVGLANLFVVYLGWSGTYVAIRFAVREGSGFPPFFLIAARLVVAGLVLLAWAAWSRDRLRPTRLEVSMVLVSAVLLWGGGNGLVVWAEQRAGAGYAALLIATTPIFASLIEAVVDRKIPSTLFIGALVVGFAGVGLLAIPVVAAGTSADLWAMLALIGAPASWAAGSVLSARHRLPMSAIATSAYQHLVGGLLFIVLALVAREPTPVPTTEAWLAWAYLVVIGSVVTFTAYMRALHRLPTSVVMTYSYVNPVGAVILAALLLGESITSWTIAGAGLVLLGVAGVFRSRRASA
jgi:drug/metabolite transporter (DMT)-like permease